MTTDAPTKLKVHIRWMIRRDMPEVLSIERSVFEFPWFEEEFIKCLRERNVIAMVAEHGERVVGFMIYELHKTRLHILNIAVEAGSQRCKVGTQMIDKLIGKLSSQRRTKITLAVRETNLNAQLFFRRMGFLAIELEEDFYADHPEPAILFERQHDDGDDWAPLILPAELRPAPKPSAEIITTADAHAHILRCAKKGTGCNLSADEVKQLANEINERPL